MRIAATLTTSVPKRCPYCMTLPLGMFLLHDNVLHIITQCIGFEYPCGDCHLAPTKRRRRSHTTYSALDVPCFGHESYDFATLFFALVIATF